MQVCTMKTGSVFICMRDTIETAFLIVHGTGVQKISGTSGKKIISMK